MTSDAHSEKSASAVDLFNLDALEARATAAAHNTYGAMLDPGARFWVQKGIEAMRLAVAEAKGS